MKLRKHELLHIAGVLQVPEGVETGSISITLGTEAKGRPTGAEGEVPRGGPFRIEGLEPGTYRVLAATRSKDGQRLFASQVVTLAGHSVDELKTELRSGVALRVVVKMAEEKAVPPQQFGFVPLSLDGWGPMDDGGSGNEESMYRTGLPAGKYDIATLQRPNMDYAIASMTLNGTPILPGAAVDLESPESVLTFVLTRELGGITGTVRDSDGQPLANATVLLAPENLADDGQDGLFLPRGLADQILADGGGRFAFSKLAAGRYKVIAFRGEGRLNPLKAGPIREAMKNAEATVVSAGQNAVVEMTPVALGASPH
jgi:hypothetical protein